VLLGDGVHSLAAVAEILNSDTSSSDAMHTDEFKAAQFDYTEDYAVRLRSAPCCRALFIFFVERRVAGWGRAPGGTRRQPAR
jgi:hypothetical protein